MSGRSLKDAMMGGPGLDGYAYNADVYCTLCGRAIIIECFAGVAEIDDLAFQDSERLPQPIFFGESDGPQHCAECGAYLYGETEDEKADADPTLWCNACGARTAEGCDCGPLAEND